MGYVFSYYTEIGSREHNEDAVFLRQSDDSILAIVADGLGGYENGQEASGLIVASIERQLKGRQIDEDILCEAIQCAGAELYSVRGNRKMYTTAAVLWLNHKIAIAAHVGDSRIYQFRENRIVFQSQDHSLAQMAVLVGEINVADIV